MNRHRRFENVLLVNHDRSVVDVTGDVLRMHGLSVVLVSSFEQALRVMRSGFEPDAVLVDLADLADGAGLVADFVRAVSVRPAWRALPVVAVSCQAGTVVQLSPRDRRRILPVPADPTGLCDLLALVCDADELRPHPRI